MPRQSTPFLLRPAPPAVESRSAAMLEAALDCIITMDAKGRVVDFNAAAERTFGYDRSEVQGRTLSELIVPPHLRARHEEGFARYLRTRESAMLGRRLELTAMRRDGSEFPVELTVACTDVDGGPLLIGFVRDLSTIRAAQDELRSTKAALEVSEQRLRTIVDSAPMVLFALDPEGVFTLAEGQALAGLGLTPDDVVGRSVFELYGHLPEVGKAARRALVGEPISELLAIGAMVFEVASSTVPGGAVVGVATDVTARHRSEQQLAHDARHDRLTGLPNRAALEECLSAAVERGGAVALLNLDLDDFKAVNDSLGHAVGDELLSAVATRLSGRIDGEHRLARPGGDEFMLLLEGAPGDGRAVAEAAACELLEDLASAFRVGGAELSIGASIGISLHPADADDAVDLLRHADAATYQAKRSDRGGYALYSAAADGAHRRLELTSRLRAALSRDELELHFQPVFELATGRPAGVEALVRWNQPGRGVVSPAEFIPLAEETGLIGAIGEWVLDAVCRQARAWQDLGLEIEVAFNASPRELTRPGFAHRVGERMTAHGVRRGTLTMEIIESALVDAAAVAPVLERLDALGVRVAIDDFGAGFSSLTRLRHLTVHTLKLDRDFLVGLPGDVRAAAFVTATLHLARQLGLQVVAEGIETAEQLAFLRAEDAGLGQGYHLARPMPAAEVTELLRGAIPE